MWYWLWQSVKTRVLYESAYNHWHSKNSDFLPRKPRENIGKNRKSVQKYLLLLASSYFSRTIAKGLALTTLMPLTHSLTHDTHIFFMNYNFCAILHKYIFKLFLLYSERYTHNPRSSTFAFTGYACVRYVHIIQQSVYGNIVNCRSFCRLSHLKEDAKRKT